MTPGQIDRVFGRGRLKMVTGEHVEVFREAVGPGERRRYTKRFLNSHDGDFAHWTEREWRILARLIGHGITCVPDVVQFDRGSVAGTQHVQTYDAGVTVDQWATLLPLQRNGQLFRHAFEDCAHWWALAHHCLVALKEIHQLQLVHLDVKGDNVCIPVGPADFDPDAPGMPLFPVFRQLALIDFAFSLVSREALTAPLPIGWQREYDYQSPRLLKALEDGHDGDLRATRELDWRCDIYSLAAMLKRYLPDEEALHQPERPTGWTNGRYEAAKALILTLREHHDRDAPQVQPHQALIDATGHRLQEGDLALSLASGWTFARGFNVAPAGGAPLTPLTRLAVPLRVLVSPRSRAPMHAPSAFIVPRDPAAPPLVTRQTVVLRPQRGRHRARYAALAGAMMLALGAVVAHETFPDGTRALLDGARTRLDNLRPLVESALSSADMGKPDDEPAAQETATAQGSVAPPLAPAASVGATTASAGSPPGAMTAAAATQSGTTPASAEPAPAATNAAAEPAPAAANAAAHPGSAATTAGADPAPGATTAAAEPPPGATAQAIDERPALRQAPAPQASPKAAAAPREAARAASKRIASKPAPPSRTRSSTSVATAKPSSSGRVAAHAARTLPATGSEQPSVRSEGSPGETPPAPPPSASTQVAAIAPSSAQAVAPRLPLQTQPPEPVPPAAPVVIPGSQLSPAPESHAPAAPVAPPPARRERAPAKSESAPAEPGILSLLLGLAKRTPAPIEDRSSQAAAAPGKVASAPDKAATVPGKVATVPGKVATVPDKVATVPDKVATVPGKPAAAPQTPPPDRVASAAPKADALPPGWVPFAGNEPLAQAHIPTSRLLPPPPAQTPSSEGARDRDFALQARQTLAQGVPWVAVQAQSEVARVLRAAANAQDPGQEQAVVDTAQAVRVRASSFGMTQVVEPEAARRFNDDALKAYWTRRNVAEAFDLQLKAFGANPNDPEIAGNLAVYHLKVSPSQPETARQLALHAIAVRGARYRTGRLEDWNTYAVASALTGRDADARNALYVALALARNVDRSCRDAVNAIAIYGERMREPVDAMLNRIRTQGRAYDSPHCAWPLRRSAGARIY